MTSPDLAATVNHSGGSYPVIAGWGIIDRLGEHIAELGLGQHPRTSSQTRT